LDYTWNEQTKKWNRFAKPFESIVDNNDQEYQDAEKVEWYLDAKETAAGAELVQVPYDGGTFMTFTGLTPCPIFHGFTMGGMSSVIDCVRANALPPKPASSRSVRIW
jgi:hypothetical protein